VAITRGNLSVSSESSPLRVYAGCIDGQDQMWNGRIDDALGEDSPGDDDNLDPAHA
jgi:hypothetical protein